MARPASSDSSVRNLVEDFVGRLMAAVEADATNRARQMVITALGSGGTLPRRRGRPPKFAGLLASVGPVRRRPKQLCPVPGCTNPAAPVFGMVCAKHKDISKTQIKKYREARRAAKQKPGRRPGRRPGRPAKSAAAKPAAAAAAAS